jgi:pyruvate formate lyase activating enzyme
MALALKRDWHDVKLQMQKVVPIVDFKAFQKISLLDYPGKIAAIAWVGGCNFRCPFCYNRDLVLSPDALSSISEIQILDSLVVMRAWVDGLVVTGGEPTIYTGLPDFLARVKELGLLVKLDTNGSNPQMLEEVLEKHLVDYVAVDVKAPLHAEKYGRATGLGNGGKISEAVKRSIDLLLNSHEVDYEFRTTVVPNLLDEDDLLAIAEELKGARRYYLQQFRGTRTHVDERYAGLVPYPIEELEEIRRKVAGYFGICGVRE